MGNVRSAALDRLAVATKRGTRGASPPEEKPKLGQAGRQQDPKRATAQAMRARIERGFLRVIKRGSLIPTSSIVVVGVSGGPDSSALLLLLQRFSDLLGYHCEAAYFDHQIRPESERAAELQTVRALADSLEVRLHTGSAPVSKRARAQKRSLEEQARVDRYRFLRRTAAELGASLIAVGHTADDQAETILLHILRGSGLRGLAGMRIRQPWPFGDGPTLLRPLLGFRRSQTEAYCRLRGVRPHRDSQNRSPQFLRNRIRSKVLPELEAINPSVAEALGRLGKAAAEQVDLLGTVTSAAEETLGADAGVLSRALLTSQPAAISDEMLIRAYERVAGGRRGLSARHLAALRSLLDSAGEHSLDLPRGVQARVSGNTLHFVLSQSGPSMVMQSAAHPEPVEARAASLPVPGQIRFGEWEILAEFIESGVASEPNAMRAVLAAGDTAGLSVRPWRPGDRMRPAGMRGSKKLQDIFVDAKVPRSVRAGVPLVCLGGEIVWVAGIRADPRAVVRNSKIDRVRISLCRLDDRLGTTIG